MSKPTATHPAAAPRGPLRAVTGSAGRVTTFELFFDLVFVFAVTQLSQLLLHQLTVTGALQTLLVLIAVWWAWMYTAWATNWFDPDHRGVRIVLIGVMLCSLLLSAAIPQAWADTGLIFAIMYALIQVGRALALLLMLPRRHLVRVTFERIVCWLATAGALWIVGGCVHGNARWVWWLCALAVDLAGPVAGYWVPGLGRSATQDWKISGEHMAERCQLFIIVALGESILVTGATVSGLGFTSARVLTVASAFVGSVALWWIYFDANAERGAHRIATALDPGRLGRLAYTYLHLPMVAGIIITAVADELAIAHPGEDGTAVSTAVTIGGPALFLTGHLLFLYAVSERISWVRVIALLILALMVPVAILVPLAASSVVVTLVLVGVAVLDRYLAMARSTAK